MKQSLRMLFLLALITLSASLGAQSAPSHPPMIPQEPPNLGKLKTRLIAYHDCKASRGCYEADLNRQADLAISYLKSRVTKAKPGEKLALVLDIDETALSNWDEEKRNDFGFILKDWNDWIESRKAPAIDGTLRLYKEAVKDGVSVFFITGRGQAQEPATTDNLKSAGYDHWDGLALRGAHPSEQTVADYKSGERQKIVDAGFHIILNVGDQISDLAGNPQAERSVKMPDPFYYIP